MISLFHAFHSSNLFGIIGVIIILLIALAFSNNKKKISLYSVVALFVIMILLCFFITHTSLGATLFEFFAKCINKLFSFVNAGTYFVFGPLFITGIKSSAQIMPPATLASQLNITGVHDTYFAFNFLFAALIPIIFFGSIMAFLYHYGIMQKVTRVIAYVLYKLAKISPNESLGAASCMFVGQSQVGFVMRPRLEKLTKAELFALMTVGMATVADSLLNAYQIMGGYLPYVLAASILSAPAALIMAKIMFPETQEVEHEHVENVSLKSKNGIDAIGRGASEGWKVAMEVGAMLIAFLAFIALLRWVVFKVSAGALTLDMLIGYIFSPIAYLIGVPHGYIMDFATLIGQKTVFNEFVAYSNLGSFFPNIVTSHGTNFIGVSMQEIKAYKMTIFALTGFANFSSIAIQIAAIGTLCPSQKSNIASLGLKALLGAVLANLLSATIVGILLF